MSSKHTVGHFVAAFLAANGVETAFGVISIHNMPMLDAIGQANALRFVPARGEAGAVNMADAAIRASGKISAAFTSTGTGAGNAAGALIEAQTAGVPLLHFTGQIETAYYGKGAGYIHEAVDQLGMLTSVSKAAFHLDNAEQAPEVLSQALRTALTAPMGPVSIQIPIDVQTSEIDWPVNLEPVSAPLLEPDETLLDALADRLAQSSRPLLWLGAGARHATEETLELCDMGFAAITSVQGRGIIPESHAASLGAFSAQSAVEAFYETCDLMLVVGSRLRGNETLKYKLNLPQPRIIIDVDPAAQNRSYTSEDFIHGDSKQVLAGLLSRLRGRFQLDNNYRQDIHQARGAAEAQLRSGLGPYDRFVCQLAGAVGTDFSWVRDITISNTAWGNKLPVLDGKRNGIHAVGGGIGQGLPMGIGAALALRDVDKKVVALVGDGGLQLCLGELATAVEEQADLLLLVMNDQAYGVIENIQKVHYGDRRYFSKLQTPDFEKLCEAISLPHCLVDDLDNMPAALSWGLGLPGPAMVEVDMIKIGPFAHTFAGPPVRE